MNDLARDIILNYSRNPQHKGRLDNPTVSHEEKNPTCGDVVRVDIIIEGNRVADMRFDGRGCAISQASAEALTELVLGKTLDEALLIGKVEILEMLGLDDLGPVRLKCALLGVEALRVGLNKQEVKGGD